MAKHKNKNFGLTLISITLGLYGLGLIIALLLKGADVALFNPKGIVAHQQSKLMLLTFGLMLVVAVPTLVLLYFFAWKYRETNSKAAYNPGLRHSKFFIFSLWAVPSALIIVLAFVMWPATFKLEPKKSLAADAKPITIQVIALRWKWLFIYPEQDIATVNFVQVPVDTPISFELSADEAPKSSFWIPHLGGQLYAMTGHANRLNLMAEDPGDYPGSSAEINGAGFAGMKFTARATSNEEFNRWVEGAQQSSENLDTVEYQKLLAPSENHPVSTYSSPEADLYAKVLMKYAGSHDHQPAKYHTEH